MPVEYRTFERNGVLHIHAFEHINSFSDPGCKNCNAVSRRLDALAMSVENILDDLVESGNGFELTADWVKETIELLVEARDRPDEFLARHVDCITIAGTPVACECCDGKGHAYSPSCLADVTCPACNGTGLW